VWQVGYGRDGFVFVWSGLSWQSGMGVVRSGLLRYGAILRGLVGQSRYVEFWISQVN